MIAKTTQEENLEPDQQFLTFHKGFPTPQNKPALRISLLNEDRHLHCRKRTCQLPP